MIRLFRMAVPTGVFVLAVSEALLLGCALLLACFLVLEADPTVFLLDDGGWARILAAAASIMLALHFLNLYSGRRASSHIALALALSQGFGFGFLVQALLGYVNRGWMLPHWVMIAGSALGLLMLLGWRLFYDAVVAQAIGAQRVLFLGSGAVVREIVACLEKRPELGMTNLGFLEDQCDPGVVLNGAKVLGPVSALRQIAAQTQPDRIVVGLSRHRRRLPLSDLLDLRFSGVRIEQAASAYEAVCGRISIRELRPAELMFSSEPDPQPGYVQLQACASVLIALVGATLLFPLMLMVALAVKLSSRGPVLDRQVRAGLHGRPFTLYKLRSKYVGMQAPPGRTGKDEPRLTPLGRWLRRLRLEALPQLFNVLKGDMSIIGPRPERLEFLRVLSEKIPYYQRRHFVKPGLTGWAQIHAWRGDTLEDTLVELEYDLYYVKHLSPALDAYILFRTLKTMLWPSGER